MFRLIIFDFDDTLFHLGVNWDAVREDIISLAERHRIQVDTNQHLIHISNSVTAHPLLKKDVNNIFEKHENECIVKKSYTVFPEMIELLKYARAKGYKLAIASGNCNSSIERILSESGVLDHFAFICGRDCTERNKPDPEQILHIIRKLKFKKQETLFLGDSRFDELAAVAAGVSYFKIRNPAKDAVTVREMLNSH